MSSLSSFIKRNYNNVEKPFLFAGFMIMILAITYQTAFRYIVSNLVNFLNDPQNKTLLNLFINIDSARQFMKSIAGWAVWSEELARYVFVWVSYLAVPLAVLKRTSIRVDLVYEKLSDNLKACNWVVVELSIIILSGMLAYMGWGIVQMQLEFPQITPAMRIGYYIPYLILPVAFGLAVVRGLQSLSKQIRSMPPLHFVLSAVATVLMYTPILIWDDLNPVALLFGYFILFVFLGIPMAFALGLSAFSTVLGAGTLPVDYLSQIAFTSIDNFPIMAIPFFIAAGVFMGAGGLSTRLLAVADELVGSLPGGVALASVVTCMFFASISGSGPATVAAIGALTIPAMIERGYNVNFSAAVVAAAGAIGVMIPPSNPFVVYAVSGQVSVGKLFVAGIIPGLLTGLALMVVVYFISKKNGWCGEQRERNIKTVARSMWEAKWALLVPVIVLGGIYGGLMTPTEAAAVAAFYGMMVGLFVYKELNWKRLYESTLSSAMTSSVIIILMAMATLFGNIMTIEQVPERITSIILSMTENKIIILLLINLFLLWIGTFMEALAAIVIITPILMPLILKIGMDPIHFGVVMVVNLAIGFFTPPVGVNLFVASGMSGTKLTAVARAGMPLLIAMLVVLMLVTYIPFLSLALL
ncbi:TRAP transporter large permease subunit [Desulfovibrio subterraneus]|uniref:C4-dicarboxylate ABC transporter substrate-binding protein n=1 Tax=Desulfovibrio subterraneus TaxID=2718620 RepID=A0A7J0BMZ7_9BACT|nr:TRAP transporter large permease subunit [Desulfovibrio subterraneus]WBF68447.1 TRAP transporter large permease subunit [Desulfovibrio subterraneus]GFM34404.1 C4-dicarboxylate ABC transporter substrate-binding protein [Desulfovibrio subterraneus]